jgi:hypothetical protein
MSISDQFIILALKPHKEGFRISQQVLNAGFFGALFLEMSLAKEIKLNNHYLELSQQHRSKDTLHRLIIERIKKREKPRKIKNWISYFVQRPGRFKEVKFNDLSKKHKIRIIPKRFLFIRYKLIALVDHTYQRKITGELLAALKSKSNLTPEIVSLLALVQACKMHKILSSKKEDQKRYKEQLKALLKDNEIAKNVDGVIKEMQAAVMTAVISASVATTAAGGS